MQTHRLRDRVVNTGQEDIAFSYRTELARKAIHFTSVIIPISFYLTSRNEALAVLIPATLLVVAIDVGRYYNSTVNDLVTRFFGKLLRSHESDAGRKRLSGASYVLISATLCVLLFPKLIAFTSFLILIISDMMSALIGKRYGKRRFLGKSLAGSTAFFVSALIVIALTPKLEYLPLEYAIGIAAAAVGAIVEALPWQIDDNLTIPIAVGCVMWGAYAVFLPSLDIYLFG